MKYTIFCYNKKTDKYTFEKVESTSFSNAFYDAKAQLNDTHNVYSVVSNIWKKLYNRYVKAYNFLDKYGWDKASQDLYDFERNYINVLCEYTEIIDFRNINHVWLCEIEKCIYFYEISDSLFNEIVEYLESIVNVLKNN